MNFTFKSKITKDLILSRVSEEQLMEYYLHIRVKKGLFKSPLRVDHHETCSFYRNGSGELIFKDFATGQHLNVFAVVCTIFHCNYQEALRIIANDMGIVEDENIQKNPGRINKNPVIITDKEVTKIQVEVQDFTEKELKWWDKFGITPELLKFYNVYSCKHVFINGKLIAESQPNCPIFGYYGGKAQKDYDKYELWRCYFPRRKNYRFITNWPSKKIQGLKQLNKNGLVLCITKSMKDVMCLRSLGIMAIAPNSEHLFISDSVLEDLKSRFKYIVVFYDNDRPGKLNMAKIRRQHPDLIYTCIPEKYNSKDISDFYKNHGRSNTLELIKQFCLWVKKHRHR